MCMFGVGTAVIIVLILVPSYICCSQHLRLRVVSSASGYMTLQMLTYSSHTADIANGMCFVGVRWQYIIPLIAFDSISNVRLPDGTIHRNNGIG